MKKFFLMSALALGATSFAFAGNPKTETKAASESTTENSTAIMRWYHFNGDATNPSDLTDPGKYTPVTGGLVCDETVKPYRCEIYILSQEANQDLPDLSQSVQDETFRNEP